MQFRNIETSGGSNNFVKLKDKESVVGVFVGDVYEFFQLWEDKKVQVVPEGTPGATFRFRLNFIVKEGSTFVPKIFEQGAVVYQQLNELNAEYGLDTIYVKITRNGTGMDTAYSILPSKNQIKPEELKNIQSIPLLNLQHKAAPTDNAPIPKKTEAETVKNYAEDIGF